ncbi:MAG: transporter substrate-binding domain-containing protein [Pseudomonadales bacterium]|nr:transporter substrate-binding domain-containing protein [Pseudomonadales bacterium]
MKLLRVMLISLAILYTCSSPAQQHSSASNNPEQVVKVALGGTGPQSRVFRIASKLLAEISKFSGLKLELVYLPTRRATAKLLNGGVHAEMARIASYRQHVPSAIMITESVASLPVHVYTVNADFIVDGWSSLKPYTVLRVHGWLYTRKNLEQHQSFTVVTPLEGFRLLEAHRADVFPLDSLSAAGLLSLPEFKDTRIKRLEPPVHILHTYTFFSADYPLLAQRYQSALIKLKQQGIYQKILNETQ